MSWKVLRLPTIAAALVLALAAGAQAASYEHIRNGSLETGGDWQRIRMIRADEHDYFEVPARWYVTGVTGRAGYRRSGGQDGTRCWYTGGWYILNQHISGLQPGVTYRVSFYGKGTAPGHTPRLTLYWNGRKQFDWDGLNMTGNWTYYSRTFTLSAKESTGAIIALNSTLGGGGGAWFDNISLVREPAPLENKDWHIRLAAAVALGNIGGEKAIGTLVEVLADREQKQDLRREAARALGKTGKAAIQPLAKFIVSDRKEAHDNFKRLLALLDNPDHAKREKATKDLIGLGHAVVPYVIAARAKTDDPEVRMRLRDVLRKNARARGVKFLPRVAAIEALGVIKDAEAVDVLTGSLKDAFAEVRTAAAKALLEIKDPRAVEPLIAALKDTDRRVRASSAEALAALEDKRAVEPLIAALDDWDSEVRYWSAKFLAWAKDPRAAEPLLEAMMDRDPRVRWMAVRGLSGVGPSAVKPLIEALGDSDIRVCGAVTAALARIGEPAVQPLLDALRNRSWRVRRGAVIALGKMKEKRAVEALIALLKRKRLAFRERSIHREVMTSLAQIGSPEATKVLIETLGDEGKLSAAIPLLGMAASDAGPLFAALSHDNVTVRRSAAEVLGKMELKGALEPLLGALQDEQRSVRT
ncbi:MAG: HEAT repeat domain-containing protein, partial [Planctomycetia bacterium]|nr:HEAT repeat domain-containing protein [Planctomycetia bacterium]